jgi:asparagine synthase (glutamine-hydrolysing)
MCGIAGLVDRGQRLAAAELGAIAERMAAALHHRGPDDAGVWVEAESGAALGHRRLSIVDLSPAGHQPMVSADGRFVVSYNGEIYNFRDLRPQLEARGVRFRGHSDTEVLIEGCAAWGIETTVKRLIGMFAFALWDRRERTLHLVRDRLGIKPLYWGQFGSLLLFGSELKALRACPRWPVEIDDGAVAAYLRHNYVPAPHSIYRGVRKLPPGHILTLRPGDAAPGLKCYWSARAVARAGALQPHRFDDAEAAERLETLLADAVGRRMIADVPLGAFLSGGIDSSTVVALMQAQSSRPVKTYSIGFRQPGYDEAAQAKAVAAHLGTDHTELYVDPGHALAVIPRLAEWFDEPFADSSQIPTFLVSELARRHVTVALSGDGGDELFAGYNRYLLAGRLWRVMHLLPRSLRQALAGTIHSVSPAAWDRLGALLPPARPLPQAGDKLHKLARVLPAEDVADLYRRIVTHWEPAEIAPTAAEPAGLATDPGLAAEIPDVTARMQFLDLVTYLPDDILTKVDRASMAVSLEARVPLIDHRVVEFALALPPTQRRRGGVSKWLLRRVLHRHVPPALVERPKMGFGVPIDRWLRHELRDWAEDLLAPAALGADGLLDGALVRRHWQEHLSGRRNHQHLLWGVLMLRAWRHRWLSAAAARSAA